MSSLPFLNHRNGILYNLSSSIDQVKHPYNPEGRHHKAKAFIRSFEIGTCEQPERL